MNVYPDGRKIIYHNGWWHGNNAVFIRMIQDSVTIIVLGNKYNRNIYQAKQMEKYFDGEDTSPNDEENAEMPQQETISKVNPVKKASSVTHRSKPVKKHTVKAKR